MQDVEGLELAGGAAGLLDALPRLLPVLEVQQGLQQRVVVAGQVARRALAGAVERVKLQRLHDELKPLQHHKL